jgi:hypothetical protein
MGTCACCGCDWLPCAQKGECVGRVAFWWWKTSHPREYRRERARISAEYEDELGHS